MICRHSLLWRNVAEHSFLLVVVAAHSLVSLAFLTSDEFFQLKLRRKWVFQQTARGSSAKNADNRLRQAGDTNVGSCGVFDSSGAVTHISSIIGTAPWVLKSQTTASAAVVEY